MLTFDMHLDNLLESAAPSMPGQIDLTSFAGHFRLINAQLLQVGPNRGACRATIPDQDTTWCKLLHTLLKHVDHSQLQLEAQSAASS